MVKNDERFEGRKCLEYSTGEENQKCKIKNKKNKQRPFRVIDHLRSLAFVCGSLILTITVLFSVGQGCAVRKQFRPPPLRRSLRPAIGFHSADRCKLDWLPTLVATNHGRKKVRTGLIDTKEKKKRQNYMAYLSSDNGIFLFLPVLVRFQQQWDLNKPKQNT